MKGNERHFVRILLNSHISKTHRYQWLERSNFGKQVPIDRTIFRAFSMDLLFQTKKLKFLKSIFKKSLRRLGMENQLLLSNVHIGNKDHI